MIFASPFIVSQSHAQVSDTICGTEVTAEIWQTALSNVSQIAKFEKEKKTSNFKIIPLYFHIARASDGTFQWETSDTYIQSLVDSLNVTFAPAKLKFKKMGETSFIDDDFVSDRYFFDDLSWYATGLNIYFINKSSNSEAKFPGGDHRNNYILVNTAPCCSTYADSHKKIVSTLIHEVGHTFYLFHTFSGALYYNNPIDTMINYTVSLDKTDYPYPTDIITGDSIHNSSHRELVLRDNLSDEDGVPFWKFNWHQAGDLVGDTQASCQPGNRYFFPNPADVDCDTFPSPSNTGTCSNGCKYNSTSCNYTGNYVDYNGDPLVSDSIVLNYMSYFTFCQSMFTPGQYTRMLANYFLYRASQYDTINFNIHDKVEFEDTNIGLSDVSMRFSFPNDTAYCRTTTSTNGDFHGILYDSLISTYVWKWGSKNFSRTYEFDEDQGVFQSSYLFPHSYEDWKEGVSTFDIIRIHKHVLGLDTLNGYRQLAADVNNSGTVSTFDLIQVRKLLLGLIQKFPNQNRPWRFLPEYIPSIYNSAFHNDPFNMTINGVTYTNNAPYLDTIVQVISDGESGLSGFDGIKLGDVTGSFINTCPESEIDFFLPPIITSTTAELDISITANDFSSIEGFQLNIEIDPTKLEFISVTSNNLPGFSQKDNVSYSKVGPNELAILWYDENLVPLSLSSTTSLLTIKVKTLAAINGMEGKMELSNKILKNLFISTSSNCGKNMQLEGVINVVPVALAADNSTHTLNLKEGKAARIKRRQKIVYDLEKLTCYPNPFTEDITILFKSNEKEKAQLVIRDIHGRIVYFQNIDLKMGINKFMVKEFPSSSGVYFISIQSKEGIFNQKIIKQ